MRLAISLILLGLTLSVIPGLEADELRKVSQFGRKGREKSEFSDKTIFTFAPDGAIIILDQTLKKVQKLSPEGEFLFQITSKVGSFIFIGPTDLTVSPQGNIYISDWKTVHIEGTENPKIFNHSPCIHKFAPDGSFIETFLIHDLREILKEPAPYRQHYLAQYPDLLLNAVPSLDSDGHYALFVPQGSTKRPFHICVGQHENIYVSDDVEIRKLDPNGKQVWLVKITQSGVSQVVEISDMAVDSKGDFYLADAKMNRVVKYSAEGEFLFSFGQYGDRPGEMIQPFHLAVLADDTLLVADKAVYKKDFATKLPRRQFDPFRYGGTVNRVFRTRIKRIQRFSPKGRYRGKILIRLDREKMADLFLRLKAIDPKGYVYLVDSDTLQIHKFMVTRPLIRSGFQAEIKFRFVDSYDGTVIDNEDDLDANVDAGGEYEAVSLKNQFNNDLLLAYDINQDIRLALTNTLSWEAKINDTWFRGPQYSDFRGSFPMDTREEAKTLKDKVGLDLTFILNHNPYSYREAGANTFIELTNVGMETYAWEREKNQMLTLVKQRVHGWGAGTYYDLGKAFRFRFNLSQMAGRMQYTADDPTGIPAAKGMSNKPSPLTRITMFLDGEF
jgi:hypothetical protein